MSHLKDLCCLQIQLFLSLVLKEFNIMMLLQCDVALILLQCHVTLILFQCHDVVMMLLKCLDVALTSFFFFQSNEVASMLF